MITLFQIENTGDGKRNTKYSLVQLTVALLISVLGSTYSPAQTQSSSNTNQDQSVGTANKGNNTSVIQPIQPGLPVRPVATPVPSRPTSPRIPEYPVSKPQPVSPTFIKQPTNPNREIRIPENVLPQPVNRKPVVVPPRQLPTIRPTPVQKLPLQRPRPLVSSSQPRYYYRWVITDPYPWPDYYYYTSPQQYYYYYYPNNYYSNIENPVVANTNVDSNPQSNSNETTKTPQQLQKEYENWVTEQLGLTGKAKIHFIARLRKLQALRESFLANRKILTDELSSIQKDGTTDSEMAGIMKEIDQLDAKFHEDEKAALTKLMSGLAVNQQAKYYSLQAQYEIPDEQSSSQDTELPAE